MVILQVIDFGRGKIEFTIKNGQLEYMKKALSCTPWG